MAFKPGHKKAGGRKKGVQNKDKISLNDKAKDLGIDPFEVLLYFSAGDWQKLGYKEERVFKYNKGEIVSEDYTIQPSVRAKAAGEACQYLYPKLRTIEQNTNLSLSEQFVPQIVITLPQNGFEGKED